MSYGVLIENQLMADTVGTLNVSAMSSTTSFDGGNLVALTAPAVTTGTTSSNGDMVWQAEIPSATTLGNLYMAYNPSDQFIASFGNYYAGLSIDPREFTNVTGRPFDVFKLKLDDKITINEANVDATASSIVVGDILESKAGQTTLTRIAEATGATVGNTALKVISIDVLQYPNNTKNSIGMIATTVYRCVCVQEA